MTDIQTRDHKATDLFFNLRDGDLINLHNNHPAIEHTKAVVLRRADRNDINPVLVVLETEDNTCLILDLDDADPERHTMHHTISLAGRVTRAVLTFD